MISQDTVRKMHQIQSILTESYILLAEKEKADPDHYEMNVKSDEGTIELNFENAFYSHDGSISEYITPSVTIWSYALGDHRRSTFDSPDEALTAVKSWYRKLKSTC